MTCFVGAKGMVGECMCGHGTSGWQRPWLQPTSLYEMSSFYVRWLFLSTRHNITLVGPKGGKIVCEVKF